MHYGKPEYIQKLIDLIKMEKSKHSTTISNEEQITEILRPALEELLNHIKDDYTLRVPLYGPTHPLQLVIPRVVSVDTVLKPERIENILTIAEKNNLVNDQLIQEFIHNLTVLKSGFKSSVVVPDLPSTSLPARAHLEVPASLPAYLPLPAPLPVPLPAHPLPSTSPSPPPSSYKASRTYKSPRKSKSPYRVKSPLPVKAQQVRVTTTKNPYAIKVNAANVSVINTLGQGKKFKKTRRHK